MKTTGPAGGLAAHKTAESWNNVGMAVHPCSIATASPEADRIVLNFGRLQHPTDGRSGISVTLVKKVALSAVAAKQLLEILREVLGEAQLMNPLP